MGRALEALGGVDFASWRGYKGETGKTPLAGFIDGDLVEKFLDLDASEDAELIEEIMEVRRSPSWRK